MISVILPTYNREKTIERAIKSVLNQSYKDIELIVVDDYSIDNTEMVVKKFKDKRLKYYKLKKNSGACFARNYGIEKSKGDYVAFQDSDDEWKIDKLKTQLENLRKNDSDLDFCMYEKFDGNQHGIFPSDDIKKRFNKKGIEKALRYGNFISTQLVLIKKEFLKENKFDINLPRLQDYDLFLRLSSICKISFCDEVLVSLYVQDDSISKSTDKLITAVGIMSNKDYKYKKILMSKLYELIAKSTKDVNIKKEYYNKSLKEKFDIFTFIKYMLNY